MPCWSTALGNKYSHRVSHTYPIFRDIYQHFHVKHATWRSANIHTAYLGRIGKNRVCLDKFLRKVVVEPLQQVGPHAGPCSSGDGVGEYEPLVNRKQTQAVQAPKATAITLKIQYIYIYTCCSHESRAASASEISIVRYSLRDNSMGKQRINSRIFFMR